MSFEGKNEFLDKKNGKKNLPTGHERMYGMLFVPLISVTFTPQNIFPLIQITSPKELKKNKTHTNTHVKYGKNVELN